jgi:hypothetical protein
MGITIASIKGIIITIKEIPSMYVINIAIAIIVNTISGYLARICPHVCSQVLVAVINSSINDTHNNIVRALKPAGPRPYGI